MPGVACLDLGRIFELSIVSFFVLWHDLGLRFLQICHGSCECSSQVFLSEIFLLWALERSFVDLQEKWEITFPLLVFSLYGTNKTETGGRKGARGYS